MRQQTCSCWVRWRHRQKRARDAWAWLEVMLHNKHDILGVHAASQAYKKKTAWWTCPCAKEEP